MRVSGRRHQALVEDNARLLKENAELMKQLAAETAAREARDDIILELSFRPKATQVEPLGVGWVPASYARASEGARALLADRLELLQQANMSLPGVAA
ncbi:hypothetical protein ACTVZO_05235 [Streptomyces sp. IBSNAI002]|uniref:hypothetical protein n=1 Tax=Streptomyces sp. IBSNAI002 TaxID=3457500 RepID=UPI003FD41FFC